MIYCGMTLTRLGIIEANGKKMKALIEKMDTPQATKVQRVQLTGMGQGRRLRVASGATAPGPALEGAPRFRPMSLSSYILR